ncbi:MAG: hypothetical protein Q8Q60_05425 [Candidatus Chromulinivorax sp.]|nr:hypothetical protein [Candidatus Chromulinivorax sp.]
MKTNKLAILVFSLALILPTTGYARYKSYPLRKINTINTQINSAKDESISLNYKVLKAHDCKKYFNTKTILKRGYQPVQITLTNNSKHSIALSPDNFSFRCADAQDVANSLHRNGMARGIGFGVGTLWFLPLIFPALIQGFGAVAYNEAMDIDFANKALKNQVVAPYTTVEGVIFVARDEFTRNFKLTVQDIHGKQSYTLYSR